MSRGLFVVLTLLVLSTALFAGWWSNRRAAYFPIDLQSLYNDCEVIPGEFDRQPVQHAVLAEWFAGELANLEEPSLFDRPPDSPGSVRFAWLRSYHDPMAVRVVTTADGARWIFARQNPASHGPGIFPGVGQPRSISRPLGPEEVARLDAVLAQAGVLSSPHSGCERGLHGAYWIVESSDPRYGYRYHNSQSPKSGPERQVGEFLLSLTGWTVEPVY